MQPWILVTENRAAIRKRHNKYLARKHKRARTNEQAERSLSTSAAKSQAGRSGGWSRELPFGALACHARGYARIHRKGLSFVSCQAGDVSASMLGQSHIMRRKIVSWQYHAALLKISEHLVDKFSERADDTEILAVEIALGVLWVCAFGGDGRA